MKNFKYDVVKLIDCVRDRECLWNKDLENYKDRIERRNAWEEIFSLLEENYDKMTSEEKRVTGEIIINKWTNIRDTFVKTLKPKAGKPKRRYIYYNNLKFLTKWIPEEEYYTISNNEYNNFDESSINYKDDDVPQEPKTKKRSKKDSNEEFILPSTSKKSKREESFVEAYDEVQDYAIDHVDVDVNEDSRSDPRIMNEDEAFFASLLPTVVKYNEDERLEFRIEVLAAMRKIRDSKKWV